MTLLEVIGFAFKLVGTILDLHAKNALSRDQLDAAVAALKDVPPYVGK